MTKSGEDPGRRLRVKQQPPGWEPQQTKGPCCHLGLHEMCVLQTAQQGTIWVFGSHYPLSGLLRYFFILVSKDTTCFLILIVIAHSDNHFVMAIASPMAVVHTLFSFFLGSGNTPIAVWGTHLDLIQNPQIRAKHGGKEHINVSPLAGPCLHTMTHGGMGHLHILGWWDKGVGMTICPALGAVGLIGQSLP